MARRSVVEFKVGGGSIIGQLVKDTLENKLSHILGFLKDHSLIVDEVLITRHTKNYTIDVTYHYIGERKKNLTTLKLKY